MEHERKTARPVYGYSVGSNASFGSRETSRKTPRGNKKSTAREQAVILSTATSQATAAAKSILLSGGTQETALSTARAAAESVLLPYSVDKFGVFSSKRQAKQQAQVVSSMALLSALSSMNSSNATRTGHFKHSAAKPPSVIGESSSRREEFSSVGNPESFDVSNQPSANSSTKTGGSSTGLPPTRPVPKVFPSPKYKKASRASLSPEDEAPPRSKTNSETPTRKATSPRNTPDQNDIHEKNLQIADSSGSLVSYFAKRRARRDQERAEVMANDLPNEDPIHKTSQTDGLVEQPCSSYDTEEHSVDTEDHSADFTDEDYGEVKDAAFTSSDDAFESFDMQGEKVNKEPVVSFGAMIVDGILCGACSATNNKHEDRDDDMSRDHQSHDSRHTDETSRDGNEEVQTPKQSSLSPSRHFRARKTWRPSSPREEKSPQSKQHERTDSNALAASHSRARLGDEPPTQSKKKKSDKKKKHIKEKIKDSMEKTVLRALYTDTTDIKKASSNTAESCAPSTTSSRKTNVSRASRLSNWIRRKKV